MNYKVIPDTCQVGKPWQVNRKLEQHSLNFPTSAPESEVKLVFPPHYAHAVLTFSSKLSGNVKANLPPVKASLPDQPGSRELYCRFFYSYTKNI
jgi:hypothetical protein